MDDKNKYNNALEKLQEALAPKNGREISGLTRACIEEIFPELKESEDERIRKEIIEYIKTGTYHKDWIAWLEKQDNKPVNIDIESMVSSYKQRLESQGNGGMENNPLVNMCLTAFKHGVEEVLQELNLKEFEKQNSIDKDKTIKEVKQSIATSLINYINANSKRMCLSNTECEDIEDGIINNKWYKVYNYMKKKLEKQEEKPQGKTALEAVKEEKIDNENKIEPKFHEGDWIVNHNTVYHIDKISGVYLTLSTLDGTALVYHISVLNNEHTHLWTIADAKDGDILCGFPKADYPWIGIFCKLNNKDNFNSYCYLQAGRNGKFCPPSEKNIFGKRNVDDHSSYDVFPATKEQCNKLLKAMTDAGYTFDFEKKELKKVEQNSAWSEEDERLCSCLIEE